MRSVLPSTRGTWSAGLLTLLLLAVFGALRWMEVPAGDFVDWLVGVLGFWWLLAVVTIPWNIYFGARDVQNEIVLSKRRELQVEAVDAAYVNKTARVSLIVALTLHAVSAAAFGALAYFGLSPVGWFAAGAALALTIARPATRLYQHVATTLRGIGERTRYPRDDVRTVQEQLGELRFEMGRVTDLLDAGEESSWLSRTNSHVAQLQAQTNSLGERLKEWGVRNEEEHRRLAREAEQGVRKLSEDSVFLGQVREILRFVKEA